MSGLSLYNIAQELADLKDLRDGAESEGDTEAVAIIDGQIAEWVKGCLASKSDRIRGYIKHMEAQQAVYANEAEKYMCLSVRARRHIQKLRSYVLDAMRLLDAKKIEGALGDIVLRRRGNGGVKPLVIAQPELVPANLQMVTIQMTAQQYERVRDQCGSFTLTYQEPWRDEIRKALERGEGVPGCRLDERGESLIVE